jgi:putative oxidoreductase
MASLVSAIGSEVGCAALLVIGLGTRLAALPLAFTMGVAAFVVHGADPWAKKELAVLYGAVFLVFFFTGSGRFSVDGRRVSPG